MKKIIFTLSICLILAIALVSCGKNNNNDSKDTTTDTKRNEQTTNNTTTDTKKNDGMITDSGTGTNIIDRAENVITDVVSDVFGTK